MSGGNAQPPPVPRSHRAPSARENEPTVSNIIDQTIAFLTKALECNAAALPADAETLAQFLQATVELRAVAANLVASQATPGEQIARNLRDTCALLAFLRAPADEFVADALGNIHACAKELAGACDVTIRRAGFAVVG